MKAYSVSFRVNDDWHFAKKFLVIAEDITSAVMYAHDHLEAVRTKLIADAFKRSDELRIGSVSEEFSEVSGSVGTQYENTNWIADIAKRIAG